MKSSVLLLVLCCLHGGSSETVRCVFLIGAGANITKPPTNTDEDGYWGGDIILKYTPFCTSRVFVHEDTMNNGWDSEYLQKQYCKAAVGERRSSNVIEDTVIYSHSMGNLIFAAAIKNGICSLGSSSRWYSVNAPWRGSKSVPWIEHFCTDYFSYPAPIRWLTSKLNLCDAQNPRLTTRADISLDPNYPGLSALVDVAARHVSGALCGTNPFGLLSIYSGALDAVSHIVKYGESNDGLVEISSCVLPFSDKFGERPSDLFYKAAVNHADGTCRNGNGKFGQEERQPATWYASVGARPLRSDAPVVV